MVIGGAERIAGALLRFASASKTLEPLLLSAHQTNAALGHITLSAWVFLCSVSLQRNSIVNYGLCVKNRLILPNEYESKNISLPHIFMKS